MLIQKKTLKNVLFLDIETVALTPNLFLLPEPLQSLWRQKCKKFLPRDHNEVRAEQAEELYQQKAGIFAEFAKIVCISVGYLSFEKGKEPNLRLKSFHGEELDVLNEFHALLDNHYDDPEKHFICGHNIKEFDIPFICRRSIINGVRLPRLLNISGKKPWQVTYLLDTMDMWRFGDYKNYTSLVLLAGAMGIPSPKDDIDGSKVGEVFWIENDIERIVSYCEKDVLTVVQVAMKYANQPLIEKENVNVVLE